VLRSRSGTEGTRPGTEVAFVRGIVDAVAGLGSAFAVTPSVHSCACFLEDRRRTAVLARRAGVGGVAAGIAAVDVDGPERAAERAPARRKSLEEVHAAIVCARASREPASPAFDGSAAVGPRTIPAVAGRGVAARTSPVD